MMPFSRNGINKFFFNGTSAPLQMSTLALLENDFNFIAI